MDASKEQIQAAAEVLSDAIDPPIPFEECKYLARLMLDAAITAQAADAEPNHWLWAIAERARLLVSEWHKYGDPIAPPLLDQLAELRNLLGERPTK